MIDKLRRQSYDFFLGSKKKVAITGSIICSTSALSFTFRAEIAESISRESWLVIFQLVSVIFSILLWGTLTVKNWQSTSNKSMSMKCGAALLIAVIMSAIAFHPTEGSLSQSNFFYEAFFAFIFATIIIPIVGIAIWQAIGNALEKERKEQIEIQLRARQQDIEAMERREKNSRSER